MPEIISPNTGRAIGTWTPTSEPDIERVVSSLSTAMRGLASTETRRDGLKQLANCLQSRKTALAEIIVCEVGKTPAEAADEVDYAVTFLTYAADMADHAEQLSQLGGERPLRAVPAGPALLITSYNDPLAGITRKLAPAVAAGCPIVVKPSSLGQLTAEMLFSAIRESGLGEVAHLVNHTDRLVLDRLVRAPQFRVLSFTGSTEVGTAIASAGAGSLKRLVLELGGNNPFLVLEGADLDKAAEDAVARKIRAAGQACSAQNRIYCVAELYTAFRERVLSRLESVSFGPSVSGVRMGPVRTAKAMATLRDLTERSRLSGAVHVLGKSEKDAEGFLFPPTLVESDVALRDSEAFGPLMSLSRVADRAEALEIAASERQALAVYLYGDVSRADLAELRFGSIGVNTTRIQGADVPTGGFGTSGVGREGSSWGLQEYLTTINERWA